MGKAATSCWKTGPPSLLILLFLRRVFVMPISGMTNGRRSRPGSKPWRTPLRFAAEFCWRWSGPNASLTRRAALLTFVIIGGGPTGVELAGAIVELVYQNLVGEFRQIDTRKARVLLIEAGPRILPSFAPDLSAYAHRALERLGVEVQLGSAVTDCHAGGVVVGGRTVAADVILWAAGVRASAAAAWLGAPADNAGRGRVAADLCVPGHANIFVVGDTATIDVGHGKPAPGIAPAAKQQGTHVARTIKRRLAGDSQPRTFRYRHAGDLATIGKRSAVIDFGWCKLRGWIAWWVWGMAHIYFLIGLRNRLAVALSWLWIYITGSRSACLITQVDHRDPLTQDRQQ